MYESREANPYYQSNDLDFDAARAEWERQGDRTVKLTRCHRCDQMRPCDRLGLCDCCNDLVYGGRPTHTDTPEQTARAAISAYREYTERFGQPPEQATESAVREVLEGLAVDVEAIRAERAAEPGPTAEQMAGWPL